MSEEGLDDQIVDLPGTAPKRAAHGTLAGLIERMNTLEGEVSIGVVGKYVELEDAYKSLREALVHGGIAHGLETKIQWIEAEHLEGDHHLSELDQYDGIWCRAVSASAEFLE